ncbi:MAG: hypothetical protein HOV79_13030 [Hamadaea sp.]|nr:hypothetical protein [Hamadaea sp.]
MDENASDSSGPALAPAFFGEQPAPAKGAEVLIRVSICALSAVLVSLAWFLMSDANLTAKAWGVIMVGSTLAIVTLNVGYTRSETAKTRLEIAASEARIIAALDRAGNPEPPARQGGNGRRRKLRKRPGPREPAPGEIDPELRIFLEGRDSAYGDDP